MIIVIIVLTQLQNLEYLKLSLLYQNLLMTSKYIIPHSTIILQSQLNFHIFLHHQTLVRKNGRPSSTRTPKVVRINTLILCENFVFVLNSIKTPVLDTWLSQPSTSVFNYRYVSLWMLTGSMYTCTYTTITTSPSTSEKQNVGIIGQPMYLYHPSNLKLLTAEQ